MRKIAMIIYLALLINSLPAVLSADSLTTPGGSEIQSTNPVISLNRSTLYFAITPTLNASAAGVQEIIITNSGSGILEWTVSVNTNWLRLSAFNGIQSDAVEVSIYHAGLSVGTHTGIISFTDSNAANSPQTVTVTLRVYPSGTDAAPFGSFDSPADDSTVTSSIPVTGWALDDLSINKVTIRRDGVADEGEGHIYVGEASLVDGARPDVETAFPNYPMNYQAGWGYMLLTNTLPYGGNGWYKLHAYAEDKTGNTVLLGSKSIYCDNDHAVKPFGAIDTPTQGGSASGSKFKIQGWALTPMPNSIAANGSTLKAYIDGVSIGNLGYNVYRFDIAALFPGYANSNGALAYIFFDSTAYETGLHTLQWTATDSGGNTDGIGSRYFTIRNYGYGSDQQAATAANETRPSAAIGKWMPVHQLRLKDESSLSYRTGYDTNMPARSLLPDKDGVMSLSLPQLQRLELNLGHEPGNCYSGFIKIGDNLRPLPVGSTLDALNGKFFWQPGPAGFGTYRLIFITRDISGQLSKQEINITIHQ